MSCAQETKPDDSVHHSGTTKLTREVTFQFTLSPTQYQSSLFAQCAGARRKCFNHHLGRVKENMYVRSSEKQYCGASLTPSLSWSKFSLINHFNAWKTGRDEDSPRNDDGTRGLSWRGEVPESVFECASADAAQALENWDTSRRGARKGPTVGFPQFST